MKEQSPEMEKVNPPRNDRDNPIEGAATGVTGGGSDPVPAGDPDPRRPPFGGPMGGKDSKHE
jgi:hypothetical protein